MRTPPRPSCRRRTVAAATPFGRTIANMRMKSGHSPMIDPASFKNLRLLGGFTIAALEFTPEPMLDALGREAVAQTRILGSKFQLLICSGLSDEELSVTLYHEILEAATVASDHPPASVVDLNEAGFERTARQTHLELGNASAQNLNRMLQIHGFLGQ